MLRPFSICGSGQDRAVQVIGQGLLSRCHPGVRLVKLRKTLENFRLDGRPWDGRFTFS